MKLEYLFLYLLIFSIFVNFNVHAASFTSSVNPSIINATASTLINFTVNNTDAINNITNVNITLPIGFVYLGNSNPPVNNVEGNTLVWDINIPNGSFQYFSFNVNASVIGNYNFNISTIDTASIFNSTNVTVTVNDVSSPIYSSISTNPAYPISYSPGANYTFNITWNDNIALHTVIFNWNGTNQTVNAYAPNKYSVTISDLAAGIYTYQWYANDTSGNSNTTGQLTFNVTLAANTIDIYFNGILNQNIELINGTPLNVTVVAKVPNGGTIYLFKNNTQVASGGAGTPLQYIDYSLTLNSTYFFFANATGNANYTTNSSGVSYTVKVIYPPPKYSISTNIPSSYTTTPSSWTVTWFDENDPNAFEISYIELNYTGTPTNYTMNRASGTNTSTYSITLPSGTYYWKIYGKNAFGSWNYTDKNIFTISKATPSIIITINPSLQVYNNTQITVSCSASVPVPVSLYKNSTSISNPYTATLPTGYYRFDCNSTENQNYTSSSATQYLNVLPYSIQFDFVNPPSMIMVIENSTNTTTITIRNSGTETQTIIFTIDLLAPELWKVSSQNVTLERNSSAVLIVTFNSSLASIKDYNGIFKAYNSNRTITSNFTLRVLPNEKTKAYINSTFLEYSNKVLSFENMINESKSKNLNTTIAENLLLQLKSKLNQTQTYLENGDYFNAYQNIGSIKDLSKSLTEELEKINKTPLAEITKTFTGIIPIVIIVAAIVAILVYLFWPTKSSYSLKSGYKFAGEKEARRKVLKELIEKLSKSKELKKTLEIKNKEGKKE
jgi:hypothetical protein